MDPAEELREIVGQVKNFLTANMEVGFDPPEISQSAIDYLEKGLESSSVKAGPADKKSDMPPTIHECPPHFTSEKVSVPQHHTRSVEKAKLLGISEPATLEALEQSVQICRSCRLGKSRRTSVFGEGSPNAKLVFIGICPGANEEQLGRPFAGPDGELLTKIIENGMGLRRSDVYICNIIKCRPPDDRDVRKNEIETCMIHLKRQLDLIQPEVICTLGGTTSKELLGKGFKISKERGTWHSLRGVSVMPTFHPAYILRNPSRERQLKGFVWEDIQKIMERLGLKKGKN